MWGEALVFPGSWSDRADVRWVADGEDSAWLIVPGGDGDIPIRVAFDPETGLPATCLRTDSRVRARSQAGRGPCRLADRGGRRPRPRRMRVRWIDEPEPWLDIHVVGLAVDPSIDDAIDRARAMFAASVGHQRSAEGSRPTG